MNFQYNFRLGPEALWLVLNMVVGTLLVEIVSTDFTTITDWKGWALGFAIGLLGRTIPGALLAVATGGGFQKPGEPGPTPKSPGA